MPKPGDVSAARLGFERAAEAGRAEAAMALRRVGISGPVD
jgi:hypothetical protein